VAELETLCLKIADDYPDAVFVSARPVPQPYSWYHSILHGQVSLTLQRHLHVHGIALIVLPMTVDTQDQDHSLRVQSDGHIAANDIENQF
jgi:hypothetical protein